MVLTTFTFLILFGLNSISNANADSNKNDNINVVTGTYNMNSMSKEAMNDFNSMNSSDPNVRLIKNNDKVTIQIILPNSDKNAASSNRMKFSSRIDYSNIKSSAFDDKNAHFVSFDKLVNNMDKMNGVNNIPEGSFIHIVSKVGKSYKGQDPGDRVYTGAHVHCNRFNGGNADHKYWGHLNPLAINDWYGSDCYWHAGGYNCYTEELMGSMGQCDGLNAHHHGVKDCSSFSGGPNHYNWPVTAWYRN